MVNCIERVERVLSVVAISGLYSQQAQTFFRFEGLKIVLVALIPTVRKKNAPPKLEWPFLKIVLTILGVQ